MGILYQIYQYYSSLSKTKETNEEFGSGKTNDDFNEIITSKGDSFCLTEEDNKSIDEWIKRNTEREQEIIAEKMPF